MNKEQAFITTYAFLFCLQSAEAVTRVKNSNFAVALNTTTAWTGAVVPTTDDIAHWNSTSGGVVSALTSLPQLGGSLDWSGIQVSTVSGTRNQAGVSFTGFRDPAGTLTLTLGADGINMASALQPYRISGPAILLDADQTWNVADASTYSTPMGFSNNEDLGIDAIAANTPFNFGGHTVTTTGNGYITLTSGHLFSNGTLDIGNNLTVIQGGGSRATTLDPTFNLTVSAGRLWYRSTTGSTLSAAPVTLNGGSMERRVTGNAASVVQSGPVTLNGGTLIFGYPGSNNGPLELSGDVTVMVDSSWVINGASALPAAGALFSGDLLGSKVLAISNVATPPEIYPRFTGDNSSYTGTIAIAGASGNRTVVLASATAGSAAATWEIAAGNTLRVDGFAVDLGTLSGSGTLSNSSATTPAKVTIRSGAFHGSITDGLAQPTGLTKTGPGNLLLYGTTGPNDFTGPTVVEGGLLQITPPPLMDPGLSATVADGSTLRIAPAALEHVYVTQALTLGSTTGAVLDVALGSLAKPPFAPVGAGNLVINGDTILRVTGTKLAAGSFPVGEYTAIGGVPGYSGLDLELPPRTVGTLQNTGFSLNVNIVSTELIKWNGNVSAGWDVDPDGSGSTGTPNWLTTVGNVATRYIQKASGISDIVLFDDSSAGSGTTRTVNLTAELAPLAVTVNNSALDYTFSGPGHLSGFTGLEKSGTGSLTLANTTPNDFSGGTKVLAGSLRLGDGITPGAGVIEGPVTVAEGARLVLNRPDNHDFTNPLAIEGVLEKALPNAVTFPLATTFDHPVEINAGTLVFPTGATFNDVISGAGGFAAAGGDVLVQGLDPNTHTGTVTVSGSSMLRLSKPAGVNAVGGDIVVRDAGQILILNDEQIPDTANLTFLGNSVDPIENIAPAPAVETINNLTVNLVAADDEVILRNGFTVNGTAAIAQGSLGVASGSTASANSVRMTTPNTRIRIGASGSPSILNVGTGGITSAGGLIEIKYNTSEGDATLNLAGDLVATGNLDINNGTYSTTGASLNQIVLNGARTFNLAADTITEVESDIAGTGSLTKTGGGLLLLLAPSFATHGGGTTVAAGSLRITGAAAGSVSGPVVVESAGTLLSSGTSATTVHLTGSLAVAGTVSPGGTGTGAGSGRLTSSNSVTFGPDSAYAVSISSWTGTTAGTSWDLVTAGTLALTATEADPLRIAISNTFTTGFDDSAKTFTIATGVTSLTGFDPAAVVIDASGFAGTGNWAIQRTGNSLELAYTPLPAPYATWAAAKGLDGTPGKESGKGDNPDGDGETNFEEFAFDSNPLSGAASGKVVGKFATIGSTDNVLTLSFPVRGLPSFTGTPHKTATVNGVVYRVEGSDDLLTWPVTVTEVTGATAAGIQAGLPPLGAGWSYRTFRTATNASPDDQTEFIRVLATEVPPAG
jgi:autotransporter-associated beta strand protein